MQHGGSAARLDPAADQVHPQPCPHSRQTHKVNNPTPVPCVPGLSTGTHHHALLAQVEGHDQGWYDVELAPRGQVGLIHLHMWDGCQLGLKCCTNFWLEAMP